MWQRALAHTKWRLALLAFAQFIVAVDYNIVYVALPDIGKSLYFSAQSLQWVVSMYAIGFGGLLLFGGRAADKLGHRRIFVTGLALFGVASLGGGFSHNISLLLSARFVEGVGAALLTPATLSLINISFKEGAERNRALAVWGAAGSGGLAVGSVLGGLLTSWLGWGWVFFIMVPLSLGAAIVGRRILPGDTASEKHGKGFDVSGAILATAASIAVVAGVSNGSAGWLRPVTLASFIIAVALSAVFVAVEKRARHPLVPFHLFRNKSLTTAMLIIFIFQSVLGGTYYLLTTYLQGVNHFGALETGLVFLPLTITSMTASLKLTPLLIGRYNTYMTLAIGMVGTGIGMLLLTNEMVVMSSFWSMLPGLIIWGIGGGITFPAMFISAASGVPSDQQGIASALASASQQIGGAIGLALLIAVATLHSKFASLPTYGIHTAGYTGGIVAIAGSGVALTLHYYAKRRSKELVGNPNATTT